MGMQVCKKINKLGPNELVTDERGFVQWVVMILILVVAVGFWGLYKEFGDSAHEQMTQEDRVMMGAKFHSVNAF